MDFVGKELVKMSSIKLFDYQKNILDKTKIFNNVAYYLD
jgi:hypothetical protein